MKIKLNICDRINLMGMLPNQADFADLIVATNIRELIQFSSKEIDEFEIAKLPMQQVIEKNGEKNEKEFELSQAEVDLIFKMLEKINSEKTMPVNSLFLKLVNKLGWEPGKINKIIGMK